MTPNQLKELRQELSSKGFSVSVEKPFFNQATYTITNHYTQPEWPSNEVLIHFCDGFYDHNFPRRVDNILRYVDHVVIDISYGP